MNEELTLSIDNFKLTPASIEEYPTIQNMGRFYVYDMSQFFTQDAEWAMPKDGLYECIDFKKYWASDNTWPFLLQYHDELAGFVIIDKKGSDIHIDYNMAQFFILRKFKGQGVGRAIAKRCFDQFKGVWEVMVLPENTGAYHFWQHTIQEYTHNTFETYQRRVKHLNDTEKKIFRFSSMPSS